jgi:CRP/FNR family transcriptional regulator, nitrogen oxide reductase regulator
LTEVGPPDMAGAMSTHPLEPGDLRRIGGAALFKELSAGALEEVVAEARRVKLRVGQAVFRQGSPAESVFLILQGRVKMIQSSPEGHAVALRVLGPGELLGLVAALGERSYPVTAQAQQAVVVARWSGPSLWKLLERHPPIASGALRMALGRLHELQEQFRELATERVERRIARALLRLVRQAGLRVEGGVSIDMPLTRQDLAEMSGTTLYTVSRVLTGWAEQGVLEVGRKKVLVRKPHALVAIAEELSAGP